MIKTRLTELVGIKYPIIQAGMGPYPVTSLCIAAANAGCLGLCSTFATASRETNKVVFDDFLQRAAVRTPGNTCIQIMPCSFTKFDQGIGSPAVVTRTLNLRAISGSSRSSLIAFMTLAAF